MLFGWDIQKRCSKYKPFSPIYKRQEYIFCCVVIILKEVISWVQIAVMAVMWVALIWGML